MSWIHLVGHHAVVEMFDVAFRNDRLGHAYLFIGTEGVGRHTFAKELAKALLCSHRKKPLEACDHCESCRLVDAETHPDLSMVARPEEMVSFPIELIRDLLEQLTLKPAKSNRRIAIIDDADDLNAEAANAFLKTLEEPSPGSVLILIGGPSTERQLPTILSRCQIVRFAPLRPALIQEAIRKKGVSDPELLTRIVQLCNGSIGQAFALNDEKLWGFRKAIVDLLGADKLDFLGFSTLMLESVEAAGKSPGLRRRQISLMFRLIISVLQDALRLNQGGNPLTAQSSDLPLIEKIGTRWGTEKLMAMIERTIEADLQNDRNVTIDLIIEALGDAYAR